MILMQMGITDQEFQNLVQTYFYENMHLIEANTLANYATNFVNR